MRFNVHPCIISINYLFQQNSYPICVVSIDVKKGVEVRYRKSCKLLGTYSLSFDSLFDLHFRVQTVFNQFLTLWRQQRKMSFFIQFSCMILALKMKTEFFYSFLETRQPIWNWEILEYDWVELSDNILSFLFKNGVTAKIQWRKRNIISTLRMMKCKRLSIDDL